jgi:ASC-1-like (ASCH) protein
MKMKLDTIYFDYIKNKVKLYETRVYDSKRREIKLLDVVEFEDRSSNRKFKARIVELAYFKNFKDAIEPVGIKKVLPNAKSLKMVLTSIINSPMAKGDFIKMLLKNMVSYV